MCTYKCIVNVYICKPACSMMNDDAANDDDDDDPCICMICMMVMMNGDEDEARLSPSCIFRVFPRVFSLPIPLPFSPGVPEVDPIDVAKRCVSISFVYVFCCILLYVYIVVCV